MSDNFLELSKDKFLARLLEAGWSRAEAEKEWQEVQEDEEGEP